MKQIIESDLHLFLSESKQLSATITKQLLNLPGSLLHLVERTL